MDKEDVIYLAAILDVNSGIGIDYRKSDNYYISYLTITHTSEDFIKWFADKFGGSYHGQRWQQKEYHKRLYKWRFPTRKFEALLPIVLPYMRVKNEQVKCLIQFRDTVDEKYGTMAEGINEIRKNLYERCKELNREAGNRKYR